MKTFICSTCKEKSDNPEEYTYPIEDLGNPWENDPTLLECETCYQNFINDEQRAKHEKEL